MMSVLNSSDQEISGEMPKVEYSDFAKLDLRVGEVVTAIAPDWSNKLLQLTVNFGDPLGEKTIFAGVKKYYQPADLIGHKYVFVANLAEKKLGQGISQGMMLMGDVDGQPVKFELPTELTIGSSVR